MENEVRNYKVYIHYFKNEKEPFYVGMTRTEYRAYGRTGRTNEWLKKVGKKNFKVGIVMSGLSEKEASRLETQLILKYGLERFGGILVNHTYWKGGMSKIDYVGMNVGDSIKRTWVTKNGAIKAALKVTEPLGLGYEFSATKKTHNNITLTRIK